MTIYRFCGSLSDVPNYAAYLKKVNGLRAQYSDFLLKGRFIDNEGFTLDNPAIVAKACQAADDRIAVALWNAAASGQSHYLTNAAGVEKRGELSPEGIAVTIIA